MERLSMKNYLLTILLSCGALLAFSPLSAATNSVPSLETLSERWLNERDEAVEKLADLWLKEPKDEALKPLLLEVISLEVRLSTRDNIELYTAKIGPTRDVDEATRRVALAYLETTGWNPDSAAFVEGRRFDVALPEGALAPQAAKPAPAPEKKPVSQAAPDQPALAPEADTAPEQSVSSSKKNSRPTGGTRRG
ncbi:MAG: hypothetical protein AAGA45_05560 [Verrucomicrobiota bacterium]